MNKAFGFWCGSLLLAMAAQVFNHHDTSVLYWWSIGASLTLGITGFLAALIVMATPELPVEKQAEWPSGHGSHGYDAIVPMCLRPDDDEPEYDPDHWRKD